MFLDAIMNVIAEASLSDEEWDDVDDTGLDAGDYNIEAYNVLLAILDERESVSTSRDRLRAYFLARGLEVPTSDNGKTNIFVGADIS